VPEAYMSIVALHGVASALFMSVLAWTTRLSQSSQRTKLTNAFGEVSLFDKILFFTPYLPFTLHRQAIPSRCII